MTQERVMRQHAAVSHIWEVDTGHSRDKCGDFRRILKGTVTFPSLHVHYGKVLRFGLWITDALFLQSVSSR